MELGLQNRYRDGLLGHNSILVVYMDPLGYTMLNLVSRSSSSSSSQSDAEVMADALILFLLGSAAWP